MQRLVAQHRRLMMAMTKKEQAAMQAAIDRAETLAALPSAWRTTWAFAARATWAT